MIDAAHACARCQYTEQTRPRREEDPEHHLLWNHEMVPAGHRDIADEHGAGMFVKHRAEARVLLSTRRRAYRYFK